MNVIVLRSVAKREIPAVNGFVLRPARKYSSVVRCYREKWNPIAKTTAP